ncbi:LysE family translocator [Aequorivita capsosiphonis]|uniref:LysE family translocator n=1 Tax=Aequorivita capsosiphonis TaxID=487317 RepID=UPI0004237AC0|nr:LysE family translocator [Aequorivita capsosiphonis]
MGIENFMTFGMTALFFIMIPGTDTLFVLNRTISQGRSSGTYAALGVNAGVIVHTLLAALGLSILVAQSDLAFKAIKYVGAIYIIYLGVAQIRTKATPMTINGVIPIKGTRKSNFVSGFFTNALNPKVALFFLAFFPQFITPSQIQSPIPFLVLGITYTLIGIGWYLFLTFFAGQFSKNFQENPKANLWINKISGIVFVLMGLGIAFAG